MKKLLSIVIIALAFLPLISHAQDIILIGTTINLTVVNQTDGGDGIFHYDVNDDFNGQKYDSFDITTAGQNGSHTGSIFSFFPGNIVFNILETAPVDWHVKDVTCSGDGLITTGSSSSHENVFVTASPFANIICVFNNENAVSKIPVLIVPGILGTEIKRGNQKLWADLDSMIYGGNGDSFMDPLAFFSNLQPVDSGVSIDKVIQVATGTPETFLNFDYTKNLTNLLTSPEVGYVENQNLFTFPYDWRYGVMGGDEINVKALKQKIADIMSQTRSDKVDVIAHSTGGLLLKKYVMENPSDHHIGKAIMVGVPNLGTPKAVKVLTQGDSFGVLGLNDEEIKKIIRNMPVAYELLPDQTYVDRFGNFIRTIEGTAQISKDLTFQESKDFLINDHGFNAMALASATTLHSLEFDNFDLRINGVDTYNIVGCKSGTFGTLVEGRLTTDGVTTRTNFIPKLRTGDSTVPKDSADTLPVDNDKKFYAIKAVHGKMLSANGIRQEIVNLLTGSSLPTGSNVISSAALAQNSASCALKGKKVSIFSPVDVSVSDADGSRLGVAPDGSLQNDVPGADFEIFGDHKFLFLPDDDGQSYSINLYGSGTGTFTLTSSEVVDGVATQTDVFSNLPVTPALSGTVNISSTDQTTLVIDNGSGVQTVAPSAIINGEQANDVVSPVTVAMIIGSQGKPGFYRSDVNISLSVIDPIIARHENETSGILKTVYHLDGGSPQDYSSATPIHVAKEGAHTLVFFSTDKAGNNETEQTLNFTIDKTAPDVTIQFDPARKDLKFSGTDNISTVSSISVTDNDDLITLTDEAGNTTELILKEKSRKKKLQADIRALHYNGVAADLSRNEMSFGWQFDKQGNLNELHQKVKSRKDFVIKAEYENGLPVHSGWQAGRTKLEGRDKGGKISKTLPGLVLLAVKTSNGDLMWGY